jgi:CheY-like chemotaxis protein
MHANAHHHHHPHHRFQAGHHLSKLSSARVIPVDDEYAPHERMMDRNMSLNSLSSIKETSSGDQHSVKSGHSGKRYGLLTPQSLLANGSSNVNGVTNSSPLSKASPIIANMPMVAESESPSPIASGSGGGRSSFSALRSPLASAPPLSPLTAASTPAAANTPMMMLMKPIAEQPRDTAPVNGNNLFIAPKRILIVDDSMPIRKMCSMILKQHGHAVVTAMNGKEALQMMIQACDARVAAASSSPAGTVPASEIDLVLMDIQMPVMDGLEAVTLYRAHESPLLEKLQQAAHTSPASSTVQMKPLLIIGMSACSDVDIIEKGLSIGMDRFVAKPFQIHHLTPIIHDYFEDSESLA